MAEINAASQNMDATGYDTSIDDAMKIVDTMSYLQAQMMAVHHAMQNLKDFELQTGYTPTVEMQEKLNAAAQQCNLASHMVSGVLGDVSESLMDQMNEMKNVEPVHHKYNRVLVDAKFVNQENEKSYLLELPPQILDGDHKQRYVWLPKNFCTKTKTNLQIRYYDDMQFRRVAFDKTGRPVSHTTITSEQFESLMMSLNQYSIMHDDENVNRGYPERVKEKDKGYSAENKKGIQI